MWCLKNGGADWKMCPFWVQLRTPFWASSPNFGLSPRFHAARWEVTIKGGLIDGQDLWVHATLWRRGRGVVQGRLLRFQVLSDLRTGNCFDEIEAGRSISGCNSNVMVEHWWFSPDFWPFCKKDIQVKHFVVSVSQRVRGKGKPPATVLRRRRCTLHVAGQLFLQISVWAKAVLREMTRL